MKKENLRLLTTALALLGGHEMSVDLEKVRIYLEGERARLFRELNILEDHQSHRIGNYSDNTEHKVGRRIELEHQILSNQRAQQQLMEVDHALKRLYEGSYGLCESCSEPIPSARLEAIPQATLCINCKTKEEKSQVNCDRIRSLHQ